MDLCKLLEAFGLRYLREDEDDSDICCAYFLSGQNNPKTSLTECISVLDHLGFPSRLITGNTNGIVLEVVI